MTLVHNSGIRIVEMYDRFKIIFISWQPEDLDSLRPKSAIGIVIRDARNGVLKRSAEVQLENAYEVKLYLDGGIICQMAKS